MAGYILLYGLILSSVSTIWEVEAGEIVLWATTNCQPGAGPGAGMAANAMGNGPLRLTSIVNSECTPLRRVTAGARGSSPARLRGASVNNDSGSSCDFFLYSDTKCRVLARVVTSSKKSSDCLVSRKGYGSYRTHCDNPPAVWGDSDVVDDGYYLDDNDGDDDGSGGFLGRYHDGPDHHYHYDDDYNDGDEDGDEGDGDAMNEVQGDDRDLSTVGKRKFSNPGERLILTSGDVFFEERHQEHFILDDHTTPVLVFGGEPALVRNVRYRQTDRRWRCRRSYSGTAESDSAQDAMIESSAWRTLAYDLFLDVETGSGWNTGHATVPASLPPDADPDPDPSEDEDEYEYVYSLDVSTPEVCLSNTTTAAAARHTLTVRDVILHMGRNVLASMLAAAVDGMMTHTGGRGGGQNAEVLVEFTVAFRSLHGDGDGSRDVLAVRLERAVRRRTTDTPQAGDYRLVNMDMSTGGDR